MLGLSLGNLYVQQEEVDKGIKVLSRAPNSSHQAKRDILFTLGNAHFQKGNYEVAKDKTRGRIKN